MLNNTLWRIPPVSLLSGGAMICYCRPMLREVL